MIIWSGIGFFVAVVICIAYVFFKWLLDFIWYDGFFAAHLWATGITFILASVLCIFFIYAIKQEKILIFLAKITDSQPMFQPHKTHKFFFIPVRYWPLILFLFGAGICIHDLTK
ncbi:hypothetical protein [Biostraticola tofi]|uniref:Uncharacterized protein n=1 Tax=Biostraticola tofi TaxID=466109 RepID=A0A4R3YW90_9GAMM|nr:hypothetical protein [Biostraticola tofi]TCV96766.1 hypothetical protein EDC52_104206 [Biostraticola tofi]